MSPRIPSVLALLLTPTLALTLAGGCSEPAEQEPWLELAGALPLAQVRTATVQGPAQNDVRNGVRALGDDLYLPLGAQIDFFVRPPARSALEARGLRLRGAERGWIEVSVRVEGEDGTREIGRLDGSSGEALELPSDGDQVIRLRLSARPRPSGPTAGRAGLLIERPTVAAPEARVARMGTPPRESRKSAGVPDSEERKPGKTGRRPNLVVYLIDTLRADHLGCYGYERPVSPAIDTFARDAMLFEDAIAQSSWTRPSVASLFTGLWPGTHGVHGERDKLAPEALTLAEVLHRHGYHTAGLVTNRNVDRQFGFGQGFETYRTLEMEGSSTRAREMAVEWISHWRQSEDEGERRPFFLYVHTMEPHAPYVPPERFRQRFAAGVPRNGLGGIPWLERLKKGEIEATPARIRHLVDLYDAEIATGDENFGSLIDWLATEGLLEETVVVLVSDHGEEFYEHGHRGHGNTLYAESVQVPLILRFPGPDGSHLRGRRVAAPVQQTDVLPTLLAYLGLPVPAEVEGRDLDPVLEGTAEDSAEEVPIFSHVDLDDCRAVSVTTRTWRLVDNRSPCNREGVELYDRLRDPGEQRNLADRRPVTTGYLHSQLEMRELLTRGALRPGEAEMDQETREQLRALGYLH